MSVYLSVDARRQQKTPGLTFHGSGKRNTSSSLTSRTTKSLNITQWPSTAASVYVSRGYLVPLAKETKCAGASDESLIWATKACKSALRRRIWTYLDLIFNPSADLDASVRSGIEPDAWCEIPLLALISPDLEQLRGGDESVD